MRNQPSSWISPSAPAHFIIIMTRIRVLPVSLSAIDHCDFESQLSRYGRALADLAFQFEDNNRMPSAINNLIVV